MKMFKFRSYPLPKFFYMPLNIENIEFFKQYMKMIGEGGGLGG